MTIYKREDFVLAWFPHSDLVTYKLRPALVVQADAINTGIAQAVLVLVITNLHRSGHPSRVFAPRIHAGGGISGLMADSVIMTDNIATVVESAIDRVIGQFSDMPAVDAALRHTLGL